MKYIADRALVFTEMGTKHSVLFDNEQFDDVELFRERVATRFETENGVAVIKVNLTYEEAGE